MLRFFRKMRQALVPENRFGRYFFYAIGEILLVMVGIILALQINTWKEAENNTIITNTYLTSLKIEINNVHLLEAKHFIQEEKPGDINALILSFLEN